MIPRSPSGTFVRMTPQDIADLLQLRRARDFMDRDYARPLDVPAMASAALMSPAHFSRKFRSAYGETPYTYLMTRRIDRAKALLRQGVSDLGRARLRVPGPIGQPRPHRAGLTVVHPECRT
jgi:transcriptional regulator GlxA family with amidase domain